MACGSSREFADMSRGFISIPGVRIEEFTASHRHGDGGWSPVAWVSLPVSSLGSVADLFCAVFCASSISWSVRSIVSSIKVPGGEALPYPLALALAHVVVIMPL